MNDGPWIPGVEDAQQGDWGDVDEDLDEAERVARAKRLFPRLDWHVLWADDTDEEWIHYPLLPARRSVVIYSPPKVGKSLLVLELAVGVSRGGHFLGHRVERRYRVLYIDFENDPRGDVRSRLQAMGYGPDDLDYLDYLSFPTMAGLDTERGALELLEAVHAYGSEIVIIDTVSRAVTGEENSNDTWLGLYRRTGLRLKQAGVAMLRLDHTGKDEAKGQRGGSAKSGDVDAIWKLSRLSDDQFKLECTEARVMFDTKQLRITRHSSPRLHHTVDASSVVTERDAKVAHLIELADANELPADAGRDTLRKFANDRGIKARNDVLADVIRARKAAVDLSPMLSPGLPAETCPQAPGTAVEHHPQQPEVTTENICPQSIGDSRGQVPRQALVPVPPSLEGDWGQPTRDTDKPRPSSAHHCCDCGQPIPGGFVRCQPCRRKAGL